MPSELAASELCKHLLRPYKVGESVELHGYNVRGAVKLTDAMICGVDLDGTVFHEPVDFSGSVFEGLSWFKNVEFRATANFAGTRFSNDARFDGARFLEATDFSAVTFWGVGGFDHVEACLPVLMNKINAYGNLSLAGSRFGNKLSMHDGVLMGGLWMPDSNPDQLQGMDSCEVWGRIEMKKNNAKVYT